MTKFIIKGFNQYVLQQKYYNQYQNIGKKIDIVTNLYAYTKYQKYE